MGMNAPVNTSPQQAPVPIYRDGSNSNTSEVRPKRKHYRADGVLTGWKQEDLEKIVGKICQKYPKITGIEVRFNEIHWSFTPSVQDILDIPKLLKNPSKRTIKDPCLKLRNP